MKVGGKAWGVRETEIKREKRGTKRGRAEDKRKKDTGQESFDIEM